MNPYSIYNGARGRNRTGTVSLPLDFESSASTSFTTRAVSLLYNSDEKDRNTNFCYLVSILSDIEYR